ncbi:MAG: tol-pal system protein YbgF, partial [Nannocystaceae bacterium]|nr:tol-pal system protein YbgF [Nannocystaceae bacterium]
RTVTFALGLALLGAGCSHASAQGGPATAEPADSSAELRRDNATLRRRVQMLEDRMLRVEQDTLPSATARAEIQDPAPATKVRAYKVQPETAGAGPTQAEPADAGYTLGELQPREYQDDSLWDDPSGFAVAAEPAQAPSAAPETSYRLVGNELVQMTQPGQAKVADKPMRGRKGRSAKARYTNALALLREGHHDEAAEAFSDFVATFPKSDLADNAMYWRGEAYYDQGHYADALATFTAVIEQYAGGNKAADALLKVGLCYGKLGDADNARDVLNRLIEAYPGASASDVARVKLAELSS